MYLLDLDRCPKTEKLEQTRNIKSISQSSYLQAIDIGQLYDSFKHKSKLHLSLLGS